MTKNGNVVNLEEMRPHVSIQGFKSIHVCPVALFEEIIKGNLKIEDVEEFDDFLPTIIKEWLEGLCV